MSAMPGRGWEVGRWGTLQWPEAQAAPPSEGEGTLGLQAGALCSVTPFTGASTVF